MKYTIRYDKNSLIISSTRQKWWIYFLSIFYNIWKYVSNLQMISRISDKFDINISLYV